jgi:hypothetical protein
MIMPPGEDRELPLFKSRPVVGLRLIQPIWPTLLLECIGMIC